MNKKCIFIVALGMSLSSSPLHAHASGCGSNSFFDFDFILFALVSVMLFLFVISSFYWFPKRLQFRRAISVACGTLNIILGIFLLFVWGWLNFWMFFDCPNLYFLSLQHIVFALIYFGILKFIMKISNDRKLN